MSAWRKLLTAWMIVTILSGCSLSPRYVGLERHELASKSEMQMASDGFVRNGYSVESMGINGVPNVATFKLVGASWQNETDVLVSLKTVSESLKE